jgi:SAM-dependent methyltransferase
MFTVSKSGDYALPGTPLTRVMNMLLGGAKFLPRPAADRIISRHQFYQVSDAASDATNQGVSMRKWDAMGIQADVRGRSLLDIGCAEGFFCLQAARHGARHVVGIESRFAQMLCATLLARRERLPVRYKVGVFPRLNLGETFDFVLCLSVLHHLTSSKDIWKVLADPGFEADRQTLHGHLTALRALTAPGGRCIIEMPYEYEDEQSRSAVDFNRFCQALTQAGFRQADVVGSWEHAEHNRDRKDRIIYVAQA